MGVVLKKNQVYSSPKRNIVLERFVLNTLTEKKRKLFGSFVIEL